MVARQSKSPTLKPIYSSLARGLLLQTSKSSRPDKLAQSARCHWSNLLSFVRTQMKPPTSSTNRFNFQKRQRLTRDGTRCLRRVKAPPISTTSTDPPTTKSSSCANSRSWTPNWMSTTAKHSSISSVEKNLH